MKITRDRIITAALACISIRSAVPFWYLGARYRLEFYIRFKNVPTPYEVYQQLTQVGLSNKYLFNIAISVRRLLGFFIAMAIGVPLGLAIETISACAIVICCDWNHAPIVPMSIMLWPNNEASIVFITFIGAFLPFSANTIHGVHSLCVSIRGGAVLGASELRLFVNVMLVLAAPARPSPVLRSAWAWRGCR